MIVDVFIIQQHYNMYNMYMYICMNNINVLDNMYVQCKSCNASAIGNAL